MCLYCRNLCRLQKRVMKFFSGGRVFLGSAREYNLEFSRPGKNSPPGLSKISNYGYREDIWLEIFFFIRFQWYWDCNCLNNLLTKFSFLANYRNPFPLEKVFSHWKLTVLPARAHFSDGTNSGGKLKILIISRNILVVL